ncbi:Zinc finger CCCH domain-containing protein 66 [Acorus calamus]|uniref:Zinc finger CCCH domain-containing protein 66 n=1 Tax=Acorus calamus TaxID=4465 RepID=A0AAV9C6Z9_ACOCL|nr:Zinc finger CCCH domain-containing protein 66 [Acorus calamus]
MIYRGEDKNNMCGGGTDNTKRKSMYPPPGFSMDGHDQKKDHPINGSILLELAAADDLLGFKRAVESDGQNPDEPSIWYGRTVGSRRMRFEIRSPLMIAALYGSLSVVRYILSSSAASAVVNRRCGSDAATALHLAAAGGSPSAAEAASLLVDASADVDAVDSSGNRPGDVIARTPYNAASVKALESLLKSETLVTPVASSTVAVEAKKEYPVDLSLPDIKTGIYGTDEFRMYSFKVKPCSRAYSHDWTECPYAHPGENARRRDPRRYQYSCVPCPEYRKTGSCARADACEYAHGVFECWLHPSQYRTRLCKDESACARRVCFFAHKPEELRASITSPRGLSVSASPFTPPMSPSSGNATPGVSGWGNVVPPPTLQLPLSRLKAALSARDIDFELEMMGVKPRNLEDMFSVASVDQAMVSGLQAMKLRQNSFNSNNSNNMYGSLPSSPARASTAGGFGGMDQSVAAAIMNSRASAFAKQRSLSFCDRSVGAGVNRMSGLGGTGSPLKGNDFSDWGSLDGKLDWGMTQQGGEDLNKLRKSASFAFRNGSPPKSSLGLPPATAPVTEEPDFSWVQSLVKEGGGNDFSSPWIDQYYMEQEQMVA